MKAIVTDGDLPKETRSRKVSPVTVTALGGGDLELRFTLWCVSPHPPPLHCGPLPLSARQDTSSHPGCSVC